MSLNRLRRLAGLNESFTNDPEVNSEIERKLDAEPKGIQMVISDLLEIVYKAGEKGVSVRDAAEKMKQFYASDPEVAALFAADGDEETTEGLLHNLAQPHKFGKFIFGPLGHAAGNYFWRFPSKSSRPPKPPSYRWNADEPTSHDYNMQFFRDLEASARKG